MSADFANIAATFPEPFRLLVRESAGSTNDELRVLAKQASPSGLVLLALRQTSGRGRRGNVWFSGEGGSLTFSILIRPQEPKTLWPRLALATGLAVAEAVESFGLSAGIKWPNDVWIQGKKVAGILVEAGPDFVVVGIGLNVNTAMFPIEVEHLATSLRLESGQEHARHEVLAEIVRRFATRHRQINEDFGLLLESVRERCVLTGRKVSLKTASGPREGRVAGIAPGGELSLETIHGLETLIQADEVRFLD